MNPMNTQWFYLKFRKKLHQNVSAYLADQIWEEAGEEYQQILNADPSLRRHKGSLVIPSAALYRVMERYGLDPETLLNEYGDEMGDAFAGLVHKVTSIPGIDRLLWKHIEWFCERMSRDDLGYKRRLVKDPPELYGVDILSCPYHELAKDLNNERAVLCICHMDKAYSKGFRHIDYERFSAVSEGDECCAYRLRFDENKK